MDTHSAYLSAAAQSPIFDKFLISCLVFGNYVCVSITVRRIYIIFPICIIILQIRAKFPFTVFFRDWMKLSSRDYFTLSQNRTPFVILCLSQLLVVIFCRNFTLMLIIKSMSFCCNLIIKRVLAPV